MAFALLFIQASEGAKRATEPDTSMGYASSHRPSLVSLLSKTLFPYSEYMPRFQIPQRCLKMKLVMFIELMLFACLNQVLTQAPDGPL